jgi:hypothetical protein
MDSEELRQYQRRRESLLTIVLTGIAGGGFFLFLTLITTGFFLYVLLVAGGIAGLAFINYLLWGRGLMQSTAGEREEEELRAQAEQEPWELPETQQPRHL